MAINDYVKYLISFNPNTVDGIIDLFLSGGQLDRSSEHVQLCEEVARHKTDNPPNDDWIDELARQSAMLDD